MSPHYEMWDMEKHGILISCITSRGEYQVDVPVSVQIHWCLPQAALRGFTVTVDTIVSTVRVKPRIRPATVDSVKFRQVSRKRVS